MKKIECYKIAIGETPLIFPKSINVADYVNPLLMGFSVGGIEPYCYLTPIKEINLKHFVVYASKKDAEAQKELDKEITEVFN